MCCRSTFGASMGVTCSFLVLYAASLGAAGVLKARFAQANTRASFAGLLARSNQGVQKAHFACVCSSKIGFLHTGVVTARVRWAQAGSAPSAPLRRHPITPVRLVRFSPCRPTAGVGSTYCLQMDAYAGQLSRPENRCRNALAQCIDVGVGHLVAQGEAQGATLPSGVFDP